MNMHDDDRVLQRFYERYPPDKWDPKTGIIKPQVGCWLLGPHFGFLVTATEFERSALFPDAVAQGISKTHPPGSHISSPWGYLMVVDRGYIDVHGPGLAPEAIDHEE